VVKSKSELLKQMKVSAERQKAVNDAAKAVKIGTSESDQTGQSININTPFQPAPFKPK